MAYTIVSSTHPHITHVRFTDLLTQDDLHSDEALGLNAGRLTGVLLDVRTMKLDLPEGFTSGVQTSFFINPNLLHLAVVIESPLLRSVALMAAKMMKQRDKLSLHDTLESAETHLLALLHKQGL